MCAALFLMARIQPLVRKNNPRAYQLESKDFGREPRIGEHGEAASADDISPLGLSFRPFSSLCRIAAGNPSARTARCSAAYFHVSACSALPLSDSIRSIDFVSETL